MSDENKGLLFIPDISGFTRFINEMEIEHSRLIIEKLLDVIIKANRLGLEISEIEGDAILFYKFGEAPPLNDIYRQVEQMFCDFHKQLIDYHTKRFCQCKACSSAINLSLKIITHYGEFTGYNVHTFNKLIGRDVIIAHVLLKNDIPKHEYWLVTKGLSESTPLPGFAEWMKWDSGSKQTESGEIPYQYTQLGPLKDVLAPEPLPEVNLGEKTKIFSLIKDFDASIIPLFHATGDYNYRAGWQEDIISAGEKRHYLPEVGMKCSFKARDGQITLCSTGYSYSPTRIEFSETCEELHNTVYFILEEVTGGKTRLTIDYYTDKETLHPEEIIKLENTYRQSLVNLETFVKDIRLPESSLKHEAGHK